MTDWTVAELGRGLARLETAVAGLGRRVRRLELLGAVAVGAGAAVGTGGAQLAGMLLRGGGG